MLIIRFVIFFWVSTGTSLQALMLKNTAQRCSTVCPLLLRCSVLAPVSLRPLLLNAQSHLIGRVTRARASTPNKQQGSCM